jgi:cardiolipin synthase A/B
MNKRQSQILALGGTALLSAAVTIFARNFISGEKKITRRIEKRYPVGDVQFERTMSQLLGPPVVDGNRVTSLHNGVQIFPAMLEAIRGAERSITFETFIYWSGAIARRFSELLAEKARAGVNVHVLIDGVGCNCVNGESVRQMREAGVEVEIYHIRNFARINNRTHRKLLIVDGRVGFIGGVGIADQWNGDARSPDEWRDTHFRVEGPVVAQMQAAFLDNWMKTRAYVLHGTDYFPELEPVGSRRCQVFKSSPMEGSESARLMYLLSIAAAERSIQIGNAYFVPDQLTTETLLQALDRGVSVEILVPGAHIDNAFVRAASRDRWGDLLRHGARIFEFQPCMYHCKVMIVDGVWTSVGSANFDNRSFRLNDEANLNVFGAEFAEEQSAAFARDLTRAKEVKIESWRRRSLAVRAADATAALFRSQL